MKLWPSQHRSYGSIEPVDSSDPNIQSRDREVLPDADQSIYPMVIEDDDSDIEHVESFPASQKLKKQLRFIDCFAIMTGSMVTMVVVQIL
jgi:hypothetical protein